MTPHRKLDTNRAWQSAHAAILANREAVLAVAGVFFFLPSLAFALLYPQPPVATAPMSAEQSMEFFQEFYLDTMPYMLAITAFQTVGAMAVLRLFVGARRVTVGEALGKGAVDAVIFFGAMLLVGFAGGIGGSLIIGLAAATGAKAIAGLLAAMTLAAVLYLSLRMSLVLPAIPIDNLRSPIAALRRSWDLTRGNAGRILLFVLLLALAYLVIANVAALLLGLLLSIVIGTKGAAIAVAVLTSALGSLFVLYLNMSLAAIHRQLAGPTPAEFGETFG